MGEFWLLITDIFVQYPFLSIGVAFVIGRFLMPYVLKIALRKQLVVRPNKRTAHVGHVPNVGGLNIFATFFLTYSLFAAYETGQQERLFLGGIFFVSFLGFSDDTLLFSAKKKFIGELMAAFVLIVIADVRFTNLYGIFGVHELSGWGGMLFSYAFSLFVFLLILNAINLIDGVDGLATGIGMLVCACFGIYFQMTGLSAHNQCFAGNLSFMAYTMIGALAIFFLYNVFGKHTKIFMGDSGSLMLGYLIYLFVVKFSIHNLAEPNGIYFSAAPAMAFCILTVPLFDTLRVMITRMSNGSSPFAADKNHVHHLLLSIGFKHRQVTFILLLVTLTFVALALCGRNWEPLVLALAAIVLASGYTVALKHFVKKHRKND